jgi:hypothetical protein
LTEIQPTAQDYLANQMRLLVMNLLDKPFLME